MLKPYSSFTDDILASKFTTGLLYFHSDDLAADGLSITDRIRGVKLEFSGVVLKDSGGMYAAAMALRPAPPDESVTAGGP